MWITSKMGVISKLFVVKNATGHPYGVKIQMSAIGARKGTPRWGYKTIKAPN